MLGIGEGGLEDVVVLLEVAGDEHVVEDCHVAFACLQNTRVCGAFFDCRKAYKAVEHREKII